MKDQITTFLFSKMTGSQRRAELKRTYTFPNTSGTEGPGSKGPVDSRDFGDGDDGDGFCSSRPEKTKRRWLHASERLCQVPLD